MNVFSVAFVRYAGERAAKTVAQVTVALLVGGQTGIIGIDWTNVGSVAALAAVVSVLTSVIAQTGDSTPQGQSQEPDPEPGVPQTTPDVSPADARAQALGFTVQPPTA